jgi:L-rhamnose-H+ transport protein
MGELMGEGLGLVLLAGITMGGNMVPMKWMKAWKWENFWLVYSIVSLVVVPWALAFFLLPGIGGVYASLSPRVMVLPFIYGLTWGIAQLGAGICVHRIGLGLTGSILNGICAGSGAFIPLFIQHRELLLQRTGLMIIAGTLVMAVGLGLCGWAGHAREKETGNLKSAGSGYVGILLLAIISGFMASLLNIALAFGGDIVQKAHQAGAAPAWAPFSVWPIALAGGFVTNLAYCFYLLSRNHTWGSFAKGGAREPFNAMLGGALWMGAIAIYSSGATFLGVVGFSVGWALFQIAMILTGNVAGLLTGEWRQMPARISKANLAGVAVLFLAVIIIGAANYSR